MANPFNGEPFTNGNGTMIGLNVGSIEELLRLHKKAIEFYGTCEGELGQRGRKFSLYVRDLEKIKLYFLYKALTGKSHIALIARSANTRRCYGRDTSRAPKR